MSEFLDLTNQQFNRLTVLSLIDRDKQGKYIWLCECVCGKKKQVRAKNLRSGDTQSCGCLQKERQAETCRNNFRTHNKSKKHPMYNTWCSIKQRCYNPNTAAFRWYGGKSIQVCDEWKFSYEIFYNDMITSWFPGASIDRIDSHKDYELSNCRWATAQQQSNNRTSNVLLTYNSMTRTLQEWADLHKLKRATLEARLNRGWTLEKALNTPVRIKGTCLRK